MSTCCKVRNTQSSHCYNKVLTLLQQVKVTVWWPLHALAPRFHKITSASHLWTTREQRIQPGKDITWLWPRTHFRGEQRENQWSVCIVILYFRRHILEIPLKSGHLIFCFPLYSSLLMCQISNLHLAVGNRASLQRSDCLMPRPHQSGESN